MKGTEGVSGIANFMLQKEVCQRPKAWRHYIFEVLDRFQLTRKCDGLIPKTPLLGFSGAIVLPRRKKTFLTKFYPCAMKYSGINQAISRFFNILTLCYFIISE